MTTKIKRYEKNPFLNIYSIPKQDRKISVGKMNDNIWINKYTGEKSVTQIITYRKIDNEKFVKLFAQNIGLTFDLSSFGIRAFNVLLWCIQLKIEKDLIILDKYSLDDFCKKNNKKFDTSNFRKGLRELQKAKIIAKSLRKSEYFINPHFCFNGDRVAFTTLIERNKQEELEYKE